MPPWSYFLFTSENFLKKGNSLLSSKCHICGSIRMLFLKECVVQSEPNVNPSGSSLFIIGS